MNAGDWDKFATSHFWWLLLTTIRSRTKTGSQRSNRESLPFSSGIPGSWNSPSSILLHEGDMAAVHFKLTGTNKSEFMGKPATGKTFTIEGYDLLHIVKGKAVERWGVSDNASMIMQLWPMQGNSNEKLIFFYCYILDIHIEAPCSQSCQWSLYIMKSPICSWLGFLLLPYAALFQSHKVMNGCTG